jgi:zona occludens toxin (predicted ATPase)
VRRRMPNDAKLGFLVGVAGVVVAAVLFYQNPPAGAPTKPAGPATAAAPAPAATPAVPVGSRAAVPAGPGGSAARVGGGRREVEGQTTSRTAAGEDE